MNMDLTMQLPGKLIAVEGLDGSGKSTQMYLLKRWLELRGLKVYFTEWNSSVIVKKATSKGKKRQLLTPTTFSLIHCTDFADRYERQILPLSRRVTWSCATAISIPPLPAMPCGGVPYLAPQPVRLRPSSRPTLFFDTPLSIALGRILSGRPQLKYHEAGMDLGLASDPYESFRIFQERI